MYSAITGDGIEQGDVVRDVYFTYFEPSRAQLLTEDDAVHRDLTANLPPEGSTAVVPIHRANGIVLSQDCDIEQVKTPFLLVARVYPIEQRAPGYRDVQKNGAEAVAKWLCHNLLTLGRYIPLFYLQESPGHEFPVSVADLREIHPVPRQDVLALGKNRILRLSPHAKQFLQARLAHFFGRLAVREEHFLTPQEKAALPVR